MLGSESVACCDLTGVALETSDAVAVLNAAAEGAEKTEGQGQELRLLLDGTELLPEDFAPSCALLEDPDVLTDEILPALLKLLACGLLPTLDLSRHAFSREAAEQLALVLPTANVPTGESRWEAGGKVCRTRSCFFLLLAVSVYTHLERISSVMLFVTSAFLPLVTVDPGTRCRR